MITIPNYQTSLTPFTLLEKTTLPLSAVTYILELNGKELHDETLLFLTGETSPNINRWNWFPINLTPYNLIGGQYSYKVWQTTGSTLSITGLTTNDVVETGFATITTSGGTQNPTYVAPANTQTQYIFE
jgi:hypothetical protein